MFTGFLAALTLWPLSLHAQPQTAAFSDVQDFLKVHCYRCHGPMRQENRKRFDTLDNSLESRDSLVAWQGILDQLNLGEMPPIDEPQPTEKETTTVIEFLTRELDKGWARYRSTGGRTVVRRLNRFELRNTTRDLLQIDDPALRLGSVARLVDNNGNGRVENTSTDPFRSFPNDEIKAGFDNIGDRLVMSDFLLKLMLEAAEESLVLATHSQPQPSRESQVFSGHVQKQINGDLERMARERFAEEDRYYRRTNIVADSLRGGVRTSGRYRITFRVSGHQSDHPWGEVIKNSGQPFRLTLRLWKTRSRNEYIPLKTWNIAGNGERQTLTAEAYIHQGWTPQLVWENGPQDRETRTEQLVKTFLPQKFEGPPDRSQYPDRKEYEERRRKWSSQLTTVLLENYAGPWLKLQEMAIEPLDEPWPPRSHVQLYGTNILTEAEIASRLETFARRAWRRPVSTSEVAPYRQLVKQQLDPEVSENTGPVTDLKWKYFEGKWTKLPDFDQLKPKAAGVLPEGLIDLRVAGRPDYFGLVFDFSLRIASDGESVFRIASDDGSRVLVDGSEIINHDGLHGASNREGRIHLKAGQHRVRVEYFAYGNPNSLRLWWIPPGGQETPLSVDPSKRPAASAVDRERARQVKALQTGYTAILCSPDFLYLKETGDQLTNYELASRLSYFLWSSMPDTELFDLAEAGTLSQPNVLRRQTERMLRSPRFRAFTRHFPERWLRLDKLAESPPELNGPFRVYWDRRLEPQIVAQVDAFFADLVGNNGPVRNIVSSDYTWLNENIASVFYNRTDVRGDSLQRVRVMDQRRGGILTMPAVMTATANGVDTSPVKRGIWVLESILGTPPPPPPPDVEPLSPDLRNAKTIREQLEVHRSQVACRGCHKKIDPFGLAFENFDPIGRWRTHYPKTGPIDPSTTLEGKPIADIRELKTHVLKRERDVARCLAEKLLTYSTGRLMEPDDRPAIDALVNAAAVDGFRIRDMIHLVIQSPTFQSR